MTPEWLCKLLGAHRPCAGSLREHLSRFGAVLVDRGYAAFTAKQHVRSAAEFGRWLEHKRVAVAQIDERRAAEFLAHHRRCGKMAEGHRHRRAVRVLLGVLREIGATGADSAADASLDMSPIAAIEREFTRHLDEERGLSDSTCVNYVSVVRRLLSGRFRGGSVRLDELRPDDVTRFVVRQSRTSPRRMKVIVSALRVFLRWLHARGDTSTNLAGCVPSMPDWRLAIVPKALPSEQVERLLRQYDRATAVGRRDYAIVLLLARMGLRAGEVVHMDLDDLDWESGGASRAGQGRAPGPSSRTARCRRRSGRLPSPRAPPLLDTQGLRPCEGAAPRLRRRHGDQRHRRPRAEAGRARAAAQGGAYPSPRAGLHHAPSRRITHRDRPDPPPSQPGHDGPVREGRHRSAARARSGMAQGHR